MITIGKDVPITVDPEVMRGAPVFAGTRVPVSALLENLGAGVSLDEFLDNFPTVSREQAVRISETLVPERDRFNSVGRIPTLRDQNVFVSLKGTNC